ncbi:hypothetical protein T08_12362 [Trichinella sp. T8]|nr:hypothetical protein T08_12362 [Trichinella sp. T8]
MREKLKGGGGGKTYAGDNSVLHFMKRIKQKNHE